MRRKRLSRHNENATQDIVKYVETNDEDIM
jgi:hypothetical protein